MVAAFSFERNLEKSLEVWKIVCIFAVILIMNVDVCIKLKYRYDNNIYRRKSKGQ